MKRHSRTCSCTAQDGGYPTAISTQTGKACVFARLRLMTASVCPTVCYFKKAELWKLSKYEAFKQSTALLNEVLT